MPGVKKLLSRVFSRENPRTCRAATNNESTEWTQMALASRDHVDVEAQLRPRPMYHQSASHMMPDDEGDQLTKQQQPSSLSLLDYGQGQDQEGEVEAWEKLVKKVQDEPPGKGNMRGLIELSWDEIQENWLGEIDRFPGNQYMFAAFGLYNLTKMRRDEHCLSSKRQKVVARVFGALAVWGIQLLGPPGIFMSTVFAWGVEAGNEIKWSEWQVDLEDWHHIALTKCLSLLAIFCFILNAIFVMLDEKQTWERIDHIFSYFQNKNKDHFLRGEEALYIGAFTNCWVVLWCCLDTLVILGAAQAPRDVIFDSLGLIFLFNLDDIEGDLGFITDDDWPGDRLGWMFRWIMRDEHREQDQQHKEVDQFDIPSKITLGVYNTTIVLLYIMSVALPTIAALTSFTKIIPH